MGATALPVYAKLDGRKPDKRSCILDVSLLTWLVYPISGSCITCLRSWPQLVDELLEDMGVRAMRSGGNWLTWPFKVTDLREISTLKAERDAQRRGRIS